MWVRASVFAVWSLAALSAAFWGLRFFAAPVPLPPQTSVVTLDSASRGDLVRVLGPDPVVDAEPAPAGDEPVADGRFALLGVVSPRGGSAAAGVALIAVDGQPPRAYRVGAKVEDRIVLKTVAHNRVTLGPQDGAATVALELAPPVPAATGALPQAQGAMSRAPAAPFIGARTVTGVPAPRFVNPSGTPVYTPAQAMPQPAFSNQSPEDAQDAEHQPDPGDPNPLR
jgi:general secretion pathway protein C